MGKSPRPSKKQLTKQMAKNLFNINSIVHIFRQTTQLDLSTMAAGSAFYFLMALFPFVLLILILSNFLGLFLQLDPQFFETIDTLLPQPLHLIIKKILEENQGRSHFSILSFGFIAVIWSASKGFETQLRNLHIIYNHVPSKPKTRLWIWRWIAILVAFLLSLSLLFAFLILSLGEVILHELSILTNVKLPIFLSSSFRLLVVFAYLVFIFVALYRSAGRKQIRLFFYIPGAMFSSLAWIIYSIGFSWYIQNFGNFTRIYGSIQSIIILMFWMYFCNYTLLLGAVINRHQIDKLT